MPQPLKDRYDPGIVRPTLEVTIVESPAHLRRKKKPELGIALIELT